MERFGIEVVELTDKQKAILKISEVGEIWRDSIYEGYLVSNIGRIYSLRANMLMNLVNCSGYRYIFINRKTVYVHRMVAEAFCNGKTLERREVNHIDGNKENNNASNLEWCTRSENVKHYWENLTEEERLERREVNHIDGNKENNYANNLEWCTRSENVKHYWENLTEEERLERKRKTKKYNRKPKKIYFKIVNNYEVYQYGELVGIFSTLQECGDFAGITKQMVSVIMDKHRFTTNGYNFKKIQVEKQYTRGGK